MKYCIQCGAALKEGNKFCEMCGKPVPAPPSATPQAPSITSKPAAHHSIQGGSAKNSRIRSIAVRVAMLAAMVMFFMPYFSVSCNGYTALEVSGYDLAFGKDAMGQKTESNILVIVALLAPLGVIVAYTASGNERLNDALGAIGAVGSAGILLLARSAVINQSGEMSIIVKTETAFYATLAAHALAVAAIALIRGEPEIAVQEVDSRSAVEAPVAEKPSEERTQVLIKADATSSLTTVIQPCAHLLIKADGMSQAVEVRRFPCVLGRSPEEADVVLEDSSVSRKHAVLDLRHTELLLIDTQSRNGVFVDGAKLSPETPRPVAVGNQIRIGRVEIEITKVEGV